MSIATRKDRQRALRSGSWWSMVLPTADGSVETVDRAHLLGLYQSGAAPVAVLDFKPPFKAEWVALARKAGFVGPVRKATWDRSDS